MHLQTSNDEMEQPSPLGLILNSWPQPFVFLKLPRKVELAIANKDRQLMLPQTNVRNAMIATMVDSMLVHGK